MKKRTTIIMLSKLKNALLSYDHLYHFGRYVDLNIKYYQTTSSESQTETLFLVLRMKRIDKKKIEMIIEVIDICDLRACGV